MTSKLTFTLRFTLTPSLRLSCLVFLCLTVGGLSGCGYTLRGSDLPPLDISAIVLQTEQPNLDLPRLLRRRLSGAGVTVLDRADGNAPLLQLGEITQDSRPVSVSTAATAAQYEIAMSLRVSLSRADGQPIVNQTMSVERRHTETLDLIAGSQEEVNIILSEMRGELVLQILRVLEANL